MSRGTLISIPLPCVCILFMLCLHSNFLRAQSVDSLRAAPHYQTELTSDIFHLYTESAESKDINFTGNRFRAAAGLQLNQQEFGIGFENQTISLSDLNKLNRLFFSLDQKYKQFALYYRGRYNFLSLSANTNFIQTPQQQYCNYQATAGIYLQHNELPTYEVSVQRTRYPFDFTVAYSTEKMELINPVGFVSIAQTGRYSLAGTELRVGYLTASPLAESHNFPYSINNDAKVSGWSAGIEKKDPKNKYYTTYTNLNCTSSIDGNNNSLLFSNIVLNHFYYYNFNLGWESLADAHRYKIEAGMFYGDGKLVGHIESWPFSTVVQSLFVNREYFRFSGILQMERLTGSAAFTFGDIQLLPELSLLRIVPRLQIETWRPQFLVFGIADYSNSTLDIREAGLALVTLKARWTISPFLITLQANQIVPVYTVKTEGPAGSGTPSSTPATKHVVDGGRWFTLVVGWQL